MRPLARYSRGVSGAVDREVRGMRQLPAHRIWLAPNDIVHIVIVSGAHVTEAAVIELGDATRELAAGLLPVAILVDITAPHQTDAAARRYGAGPTGIEITRRLALLTNSPVARMLGNAFLSARRPSYPVRLFPEEQRAVAWLLEDR